MIAEAAVKETIILNAPGLSIEIGPSRQAAIAVEVGVHYGSINSALCLTQAFRRLEYGDLIAMLRSSSGQTASNQPMR
jgi:hypothetical protein